MLKISLNGATQFDDIIKTQQQMLAKFDEILTVIEMDKEIPAQVLLSKPVILLDARGRSAPFHLEFIDSTEVRDHYSRSERKSRSGLNIDIAGFDRGPEGPLWGHRPPQDRESSIHP